MADRLPPMTRKRALALAELAQEGLEARHEELSELKFQPYSSERLRAKHVKEQEDLIQESTIALSVFKLRYLPEER